ncbi:hypothetical protein F511_30107 [Dorcoceras hygrometricum]|uniref:Uncharacterized protein n=1 Tax=Dorcoceras hygrometricum TaxID=472368 RepID=A0A2Z7CRT2_9LAMI|nr:hypothetical protein F511_30107 [Dorcoceras hygrometricum]
MGAATCVTSSRKRGGRCTHKPAQRARTPCVTCSHGYRPAHATPCRYAPSSDQFHEEIGTSTVDRLDRRLIPSMIRISTPSPVCTRKPTKFSQTESPRRDGGNKFRRRHRRRVATAAAMARE